MALSWWTYLRHVQAGAACLDEQALTTRSFPFRAGSLPPGRGAAEQGDGQPQAWPGKPKTYHNLNLLSVFLAT